MPESSKYKTPLLFSEQSNRLHRSPLHFVTSIVGARNREGKFEQLLQSALVCDEYSKALETFYLSPLILQKMKKLISVN